MSIKKLLSNLMLGTLIISTVWYCRLPDINTCSKDELTAIYMIGNKKADTIIKNRPYSSYNELDKLPYIGEKTIKVLKKNTKLKPVEKTNNKIDKGK